LGFFGLNGVKFFVKFLKDENTHFDIG
jgi:hypothetical protein